MLEGYGEEQDSHEWASSGSVFEVKMTWNGSLGYVQNVALVAGTSLE